MQKGKEKKLSLSCICTDGINGDIFSSLSLPFSIYTPKFGGRRKREDITNNVQCNVWYIWLKVGYYNVRTCNTCLSQSTYSFVIVAKISLR